MSKRIGLDLTDIAACYRDRAQTIADGDAARPVCSVVVEFTSNGNATVLVLGDMTDVSSREHVSINWRRWTRYFTPHAGSTRMQRTNT